jgi:nucleotide-binding universal stress UspA family protein
VSVESVTIEESPAHGLVDLARAREARAIVIGTRGERPLAGAILGSTAHKLLHLADRPVLVVPDHLQH